MGSPGISWIFLRGSVNYFLHQGKGVRLKFFWQVSLLGEVLRKGFQLPTPNLKSLELFKNPEMSFETALIFKKRVQSTSLAKPFLTSQHSNEELKTNNKRASSFKGALKTDNTGTLKKKHSV